MDFPLFIPDTEWRATSWGGIPVWGQEVPGDGTEAPVDEDGDHAEEGQEDGQDEGELVGLEPDSLAKECGGLNRGIRSD